MENNNTSLRPITFQTTSNVYFKPQTTVFNVCLRIRGVHAYCHHHMAYLFMECQSIYRRYPVTCKLEASLPSKLRCLASRISSGARLLCTPRKTTAILLYLYLSLNASVICCI